MAKGTDGVDRMGGRGTVAQATTLGFAIERHTLTATGAHLAGRAWVEHALNRRSHSGGIEPRKQALDGRLVLGSVAP